MVAERSHPASNPMQREFDAFVARVYPRGRLRPDQLAVIERTFYAGALVALSLGLHGAEWYDLLAAVMCRIETLIEEDSRERRNQ